MYRRRNWLNRIRHKFGQPNVLSDHENVESLAPLWRRRSWCCSVLVRYLVNSRRLIKWITRRERGEQLCPFCIKTLYLTWMIYCFNLLSCCLVNAILRSRRGCDKWNILLDANLLFVQSLEISTQSQNSYSIQALHNVYYKYKVFRRFFSFKLQIWFVLVN